MTIKQLSELVGVSKQAINNRINKLPESDKPRMINNTYVIEEPLLSQFIEVYSNDSKVWDNLKDAQNSKDFQNEDDDKTTIDINFMESVINELQKDKQELYKQIDKLQQLLQNQQVLSLKANDKILELEYKLKDNEKDQEINDNENIKLNWLSRVKNFFTK